MQQSDDITIVYFLPCKPGSLYVNITDDCLNECLFCIKRKGMSFFGQNLSLRGHTPTSEAILEAIAPFTKNPNIKEIVFCGMGEPLLQYHHVVEVCKRLKALVHNKVRIRVDTAGLFWKANPNLEILEWIDALNISLNAENEEKYVALCRPKIDNAFTILMQFLTAVYCAETQAKKRNRPFPEVCLSIVDTTEEAFIPKSGLSICETTGVPVPQIKACQKIADKFGWALSVKRLFRDSREKTWCEPDIQKKYMQGEPVECCKNCDCRH